jgi:glycosyltransferase involved in cell wall biosynthesis
MHIAQVSPLYESVPPRQYGGTERIVSYLTEELVRRGHDVTLFASGDSVTEANLVPMVPQALHMTKRVEEDLAPHVLMLEEVFSRLDEFDIVHFHIGYLHFPLSRLYGETHVTTLHGRLDIPHLKRTLRAYAEMPVVSISDAQRVPLPDINWQETIYHGLPADLYSLQPEPEGYLAFLGRISPEKRVDRAVAIAKRLDMNLKIAAKVNWFERRYFREEVKPLLADPRIEFLGEITEGEKNDFLGNAAALIFPVDWPEPFGLVQIEAMACGTPVVAFRNGAVPEVIDDGVTGFVVETVDEAVEAVRRATGLSRAGVRARFDKRFSAARMAGDYLALYRRLINGEKLGQMARLPAVRAEVDGDALVAQVKTESQSPPA